MTVAVAVAVALAVAESGGGKVVGIHVLVEDPAAMYFVVGEVVGFGVGLLLLLSTTRGVETAVTIGYKNDTSIIVGCGSGCPESGCWFSAGSGSAECVFSC
jgi:hypothetical protein